MGRPFFKGDAGAIRCAACHTPNVEFYDELREEYFCDELCFNEHFTDNADKYAEEYFHKRITSIL
jgi:hypothetical protein